MQGCPPPNTVVLCVRTGSQRGRRGCVFLFTLYLAFWPLSFMCVCFCGCLHWFSTGGGGAQRQAECRGGNAVGRVVGRKHAPGTAPKYRGAEGRLHRDRRLQGAQALTRDVYVCIRCQSEGPLISASPAVVTLNKLYVSPLSQSRLALKACFDPKVKILPQKKNFNISHYFSLRALIVSSRFNSSNDSILFSLFTTSKALTAVLDS